MASSKSKFHNSQVTCDGCVRPHLEFKGYLTGLRNSCNANVLETTWPGIEKHITTALKSAIKNGYSASYIHISHQLFLRAVSLTARRPSPVISPISEHANQVVAGGLSSSCHRCGSSGNSCGECFASISLTNSGCGNFLSTPTPSPPPTASTPSPSAATAAFA